MAEKTDWYPNDEATRRLMCQTIDEGVDALKTKYSDVLTDDYVTEVRATCQMYMNAYDAKEFNRAAAKALTTWFANLHDSEQKGEAVNAPPDFMKVTIPAGATVGTERQIRRFAKKMKDSDNYDKADGLALMIEKVGAGDLNLNDAQPQLKIRVETDGRIIFVWLKSGFDSLELQWRRAGETMWQLADKSTEKEIVFQPPLAAAGTPEKFEFRAVYILKNKRVGQWSPIYTQTVG
jgi:hypothetical protein